MKLATRRCLALTTLIVLTSLPASAQEKTRYEKRWFYAQYNLLVDQSADEVVALLRRAGKAGYNGMVLADYKLNILERLPKRYFKNIDRVQKAAAAAGIEVIPTVCPIGYSAGILAHDPNLAEGVPVKDAPFVVKQGEAVLVPDPKARFRNGTLEEVKGDRFVGFGFQDNPGKSSFVDRMITHSGKASCRMQDFHHHPVGNCRLSQKVKVRAFACYRFSAWLKTQDVKPTGNLRLLALGAAEGPNVLSFFDDPIQPTQGWTKIQIVFNSLANTEITLMAGIWNGKSGTFWLDDLQLEELSLVNVLRRAGCPLTVTSEDGVTYVEGKDFLTVKDSKLGNDPWSGEFKFNHPGARIQLTKGSRIKTGQRLRVGWYHPILTHSYQVMCCLTEPKVYDVMRDQIQRVNKLLKPRTFFLSHDEIRVANWCQACQDKKQTPGQLLAENVRQCVRIIQAVNPKAEMVVWSDMFDPHHNAVDRYYLVNGSIKNSWEGLPKRVMIANWNGGKAAASAKWFADRGHQQIIAGYYDGDLENFRHWHAMTKNTPHMRGFLYTTWQHRYDHLEAYGKAMAGK
ncbi:MAG: family 20 glycosylhydrolase [Planctomycetes bacterium]|nr:family 20 glycosylhydrolase [Planctomycetota bacterium]